MIIRCSRGLDDTEKNEPLVLPLSSGNVAAMREAGRNSVDSGSGFMEISQDSVFNKDAVVGQLVGVYDALNGLPWRGMITSVTHGLDSSGVLITRQTILRVSNG